MPKSRYRGRWRSSSRYSDRRTTAAEDQARQFQARRQEPVQSQTRQKQFQVVSRRTAAVQSLDVRDAGRPTEGGWRWRCRTRAHSIAATRGDFRKDGKNSG